MLIGHSLADQYGNLLSVDSQVCEIMHREVHELVGVSFAALTHPDDCTRNVIAVASLRAEDGASTIRKRYVRPDGSFVWANVQVSRLQGGEAGKLIGTIQLIDCGSLRRGPEGLWRAARLEDGLLQRRRLQLGEDLFSDFAWLILLQVYLAEAEGRVATVATISDTAVIAPSAVRHWLELLEQRQLVERVTARDPFLQLSPSGWGKIEYLLDSGFDM
ncbi:PAS domain-containing protein [Croceibacterium sp. TMG7-5b_MA50]|uniref:PAS domain-containing protein n=1 Tax=Croceibacterium sp. TMG7-5b_MA50 TaxID=3121290 RepID=UPI003221AFBD